MQTHMVICVPEVTGNAWVRYVAVSLPYVEALVDGKKYRLPDDVPPPEGYRERAPRGPTLRSLVRLALKCDSAEQLGKKLRRRYDRQQQRQGIDPGRSRQAEGEFAEDDLDRLLAQG